MHVADARRRRGLQSAGRAADDDDLRRAGELGERRGGEADRAAALHHDDLADPHGPPLVEGVHDGGARAGQRHRGERVHPVGGLDDRGALLEHDVVGPGAGEGRALLDGAVDPVRPAVLAERGLAVQPAGHAAAAGDRGRPHHGVPRPQLGTRGVPRGARAQLPNDADALVAEDQRGGDGQVALVQMQVGAADPAVRTRDDHAAVGRGREVERPQRQGLAEVLQDDRAAGAGAHAATVSRPSRKGVSRMRSGSVSRHTTYSGRGSPVQLGWLATSL